MFGTLGGPELFLILVVALIIFGPRKLPEIGRTMGRMMAEFRKASTEFQRTINDEVEADKAREDVAARPAPAPPLEPPADLPPPDPSAAPLIAAPDAPIVSRAPEPPPAETK